MAWSDGFPGGVHDALGPRLNAGPRPPVLSRRAHTTGVDSVRYWNEIAIDASGLDHTPVRAGEDRASSASSSARAGEPRHGDRPHRDLRRGQRDHRRATRATRAFPPCTADRPRWTPRSRRRRTTRWSRSSRRRRRALDDLLARGPGRDPGRRRRSRAGIALGQRGRRRDPGAAAPTTARSMPSPRGRRLHSRATGPGDLAPGPGQPDPARARRALGRGQAVRAATRASQFRVPPPPALTSARVRRRVQRGEAPGRRRPRHADRSAPRTRPRSASTGPTTARRACARRRGCTTRSRSQIADQEQGTRNVIELARLLALVNVAMADAGIAIWESKYYYKFWRPVTGIREADPGTGPTGPATATPTPSATRRSRRSARRQQPDRAELHAAVSRLSVRPRRLRRRAVPDPAQVLRHRPHRVHVRVGRVQRRDAGQRRATCGRSCRAASRPSPQAEEENGQSRIYLGIHWAFDKTEGIAQGRQVADYVFENAFVPLQRTTRGAR